MAQRPSGLTHKFKAGFRRSVAEKLLTVYRPKRCLSAIEKENARAIRSMGPLKNPKALASSRIRLLQWM